MPAEQEQDRIFTRGNKESLDFLKGFQAQIDLDEDPKDLIHSDFGTGTGLTIDDIRRFASLALEYRRPDNN